MDRLLISRARAVAAALAFVSLGANSASAFMDGSVRGRITFEREGKVSTDGRRLIVSGRADCAPEDGALTVSVSVLQNDTLAVARGFSPAPQPCTEEVDAFTVQATAKDERPSFKPGMVQACGLAKTRTDKGITDIESWCTLVELKIDPAF